MVARNVHVFRRERPEFPTGLRISVMAASTGSPRTMLKGFWTKMFKTPPKADRAEMTC